MLYYNMPSNDIRVNLATEEYLLQQDFTEPLVLFYIQKPCIIIGRNQNPLEEINVPYVKAHDITLTRRLSGGGAVYDDLGNVSFSFVTQATRNDFGNFKEFTAPILSALADLGATGATVSGRNDLMIDGKKFSGNAMYKKRGKLFSHGTLMLNVDLNVLPQALTVAKDKIESKGTKSVRSHVTNLRPYLAPEYQQLTTPQFRDELIKRLYGVSELAQIADKALQLTAQDEQAIADMVAKTYGNDDWIYGETPAFTIQRRRRYPAVGIIDARIQVVHDVIRQVVFYGDYFGVRDSAELAAQLIGVPYRRADLAQAISKMTIGDYFSHLDNDAFVKLMVD
ncbi:lipoate--protein ligase [Lacticaseibacillus jixiensis]|uniref:lipoate--protein ligase n=1 Tax=Lacticaseibacillus jixiensis TaxID=3231926 RepID=UPI0036F1AD92